MATIKGTRAADSDSDHKPAAAGRRSTGHTTAGCVGGASGGGEAGRLREVPAVRRPGLSLPGSVGAAEPSASLSGAKRTSRASSHPR